MSARAAAAPAARAFEVTLPDGSTVRVCAYGNGPRLVMSHGNGLAIEGYRPFWSLLTDRYQVVVFDFRHHGLSSPYRAPMRNWPTFIDDFGHILDGIERQLGPAASIGAFHSMSSLTALLHAADRGARWSGLLAFEPPCPPPADHPEFERFFDMHHRLAEGAARRRSTFGAVDELAASFARVASFRRLDAEALYGLSAATLRWDPAQRHYTLACAREFEAETFRLRHLENAWRRITALTLPVCIVSGVPDPDENRCLFNLARSLADASAFEFQAVDDATHFLQMERPRQCAAIVDAFAIRVLSNARG